MLEQSWSCWTAGGPLLIPLFIVCFSIWGYFLQTRHMLMNVVQEGKDVEKMIPADLTTSSMDEFKTKLAKNTGRLATIISNVLSDMTHGKNPRQLFKEYESDELGQLKRDLIILTALTSVAPLLGLLGTVMGMIETFEAVAGSNGQTADFVASGISKALITTQFGLVIAIPGVFGLTRLRRLIQQVEMRWALCRTHLLSGLEKVAVLPEK